MAEEFQNHYELLGVALDVDAEIIRQAITEKTSQWGKRKSLAATMEKRHEADKIMKALAEARRVLLDPTERRKYNHTLMRGHQDADPRPPAAEPTPSPPEKRPCPYCDELIAVDAKKCRWCREWIDQPTEQGSSTRSVADSATSESAAANITQVVQGFTARAGPENLRTVAPEPSPKSAVQHTPALQPSSRLPENFPREHFQFVRIPAGTFMMGSPAGKFLGLLGVETGRYDDEIQHEVTISRSFGMQTTLVTQALWQAIMGKNPSKFKGRDLPVEKVSWDDAQKFIGKLNQIFGGNVYRLPTEAEWEYAARAGTTTPFWAGETLTTDQANFYGKYGKTTPVKTFPPNPWGLYDMHGNVWEWVDDWYGDYPSGNVIDPMGPGTGSPRVRRGGSWFLQARFCRSANRGYDAPSARSILLGFRLALSI